MVIKLNTACTKEGKKNTGKFLTTDRINVRLITILNCPGKQRDGVSTDIVPGYSIGQEQASE